MQIIGGGAIYWTGASSNLSNSFFTNNTADSAGGAVRLDSINGTLTNCTFINNMVKNYFGGAVYWTGTNSNMESCTFINNYAPQGDNVYWIWTVEEFLNKYSQINDHDYVMIKNGVGTPNNTIILNKKGITISSQGNVIFDGKGKNLHFEITGSDVLVEKLTFRNFNFTGYGGAIVLAGNNDILKNCNFNNNRATAAGGGVVVWSNNCIISGCTFSSNFALQAGGGVNWWGNYGRLTDSTFIGNNASQAADDLQWGAIMVL